VIDHTSILGIGEDDAFRSGLVRVVHGSGVRMGQCNLIAPSSLTAGASSYLRIGGEVELLAPLVVRALGATGVHLDGGRISGDETSTLTPAIGFDACTGGLRVDGGYVAAQLWNRGTGADGVTGTYVIEAQRGAKVVMLTGTDLTSAGGAGTGVGDVSADWGVSTASGAADGTYISSSTGGEVVNPLGGWAHIKTVTVGVGGQAAIESGDLSGHTDALAFRWVFSIRSERAVSADALYIAINGDTTDGNYRRQYIQALGTSGTANAAALRNAWNVPGASAASGYYGTGELTINDPRSTSNNKVTHGTSMYPGSGSAIAIRAAYLLYAGDTLAVDDWDLTVQAGSSDIAEGSTASLWKLIA
jgi:hypothetical protein